MDVIFLGVYSIDDKEKLEKSVVATSSLEIVWNFGQYNIDASKGIQLLKEVYQLFDIGILVEKETDSTFSSYPLICEVTDTFFGNEHTPKLFLFLDELEKASLSKLIIAFADEWEVDTTVRLEKCEFHTLKKRLNSVYVWCDAFVNLTNGARTRDDYHPLVLEVADGGGSPN